MIWRSDYRIQKSLLDLTNAMIKKHVERTTNPSHDYSCFGMQIAVTESEAVQPIFSSTKPSKAALKHKCIASISPPKASSILTPPAPRPSYNLNVKTQSKVNDFIQMKRSIAIQTKVITLSRSAIKHIDIPPVSPKSDIATINIQPSEVHPKSSGFSSPDLSSTSSRDHLSPAKPLEYASTSSSPDHLSPAK
ncbi:Hypothetical predicted protein [Mytilus galloprovincialis]|uniref:Uncharacterized protein n=1 Tax=Mytilus galloprovincialis TaxID=29158 RepID=A0A8B6EPM7_MYTGA|nr:Hypothetical predicted protein [Mytilus galloprovincialis]